jgi:MTH538 TIR-like domain (DUF1863)
MPREEATQVKNLKNVFISHIHEDDHRLQPLKDIAAKHGLEVRDASINSLKPNEAQNEDYIMYQTLAPRIDWAGVLVVLVSGDTHESEWVNREIEYAERHDTRIVGVLDRGESDADLPETLKDYADAIVNWDGEKIVAAILGENIFCRSDGSPRDPSDIPRHNCARP